jgi:hypothetical protein
MVKLPKLAKGGFVKAGPKKITLAGLGDCIFPLTTVKYFMKKRQVKYVIIVTDDGEFFVPEKDQPVFSEAAKLIEAENTKTNGDLVGGMK